MVLLASAVCSKQGKALVSRQFVEMSRSRIEGLLSAFPKLISTDQQHTFVETESVRYVYQPLDKLFVLLITTKASNILEDLETLRLFSRVVPEYCKVLDENDILENSFELIFAFDEIVALGYRENVNLAQIRTFIEMDSHEERVINAVRKTQELEAKEQMKRKAKELAAARQGNKAKNLISGIAGGMGQASAALQPSAPTKVLEVGDTANTDLPPPKPVHKPSGGKALRLGSKTKDIDSFVDKLEKEGTVVAASAAKPAKKVSAPVAPAAQQAGVHVKFDEKLSLTCGRHGGIENMEVRGMCQLKVSEEDKKNIALKFQNDDKRNFQFQTHPNVDKKLFSQQSILGLKAGGAGFPLGKEIGIVKWRLQTKDEDLIPLTINCWPNENDGQCEVTIEYELQLKDLELKDVIITIPVTSDAAPVVGDVSGEYTYDNRKSKIIWQVAVIDESNSSGSLEFNIAGNPDDFFPITVEFYSNKLMCDVSIPSVSLAGSESPVKFTQEQSLLAEKYEVV